MLVVVSAAAAGAAAAAASWDRALRATLAQATGGEVGFDRLRLSWRGLVLRGVVVTAGDGRPLLTADRVEVGLRHLSLFEGDDWRWSSLSVSGARATPHRTRDGWAVPERTLAWLHRTGDGAIPAVRAPALELRDARLELPAPDGTLLAVGVDRATVLAPSIQPGPDGPTLAFGPIEAAGATFALGDAVTGIVSRASVGGTDGAWSWTATPAVGALVAHDLSVTLPGGALRAGAVRVAGARWQGGVHLDDLDVTALALDADGQVTRLDRLGASGVSSLAFGAPVTVATVAGGALSTELRDLGALGAVLRGLGQQPTLRTWPLTVERAAFASVERPGAGVRAEDVALTRVQWALGTVSAAGVTTGAVTAGTLSARSTSVAGPKWDPSGPLALDVVVGTGVQAALDLYAPGLGLGAALDGALPAGVRIGTLTLPSARVTAAAGDRTLAGEVAALELGDLRSEAGGIQARTVVARAGEGTASGPSGTLSWAAARIVGDELRLGRDTTLRGGGLERLVLRRGGERVAAAEQLTLGPDGVARVSGGAGWTALISPHALEVPPLVAEHVPRGLGGARRGSAEWWGVDLRGLPWVPTRVVGDGALVVADRVVGDQRFAFAIASFAAGPLGATLPIEARGEVAGGRFDATGAAHPDGRATVRLSARSIDARAFESYGTRLLQVSGLGIGPGRIQADLDLALAPDRLSISGDLVVRNLTLVVRDRKKLGAALLSLTKGDAVQLPEERIPVRVACPLADADCSPLDQLAKVVTEALVDRLSGPGGAAGRRGAPR